MHMKEGVIRAVCTKGVRAGRACTHIFYPLLDWSQVLRLRKLDEVWWLANLDFGTHVDGICLSVVKTDYIYALFCTVVVERALLLSLGCVHIVP